MTGSVGVTRLATSVLMMIIGNWQLKLNSELATTFIDS